MCAVSYIRRYKNADNTKLKNIENHSLAVILVGRSSVSNSPIFFHPHTKKLITSDDFYIDETLPAGPAFDISYAVGMYISSYSDMNVYFKPPTFKPEHEVFVNIRDVYHPATIITNPSKKDNIYKVQLQHDHSLHQFPEKQISAFDPYIVPDNDPTKNKYFPSWLRHEANATIKLNESSKYQHGQILRVADQFFLINC